MLEAVAGEDRESIRLSDRGHLLSQAGLADPGLAVDEEDTSATRS
jgi:hypothetical protein